MSSDKPMLIVTSFGGFSISAYDPAVPENALASISDGKGHSKKLWTLVEYLIFSGKGSVTSAELIALLWPGEGGAEDPLASLRLLVHRARTQLGKLGVYKGSELILSQEKAYEWNRQLPMQIDTERFEQLYDKSRSGSAADRLESLLAAAELYKGRFLPKAAQFQWAMVLDTYYHSKYMAVCEEAVPLLKDFGRTGDIIGLCKRAVMLDPYAEALHVAYIEALKAAGSYNAAAVHYKHVIEMFINEFGITPSENLTAAFHPLARNTDAPETDIGVIRESLAEDDATGAFFIEYELFKQIYQLKARESIRSGQVSQLALISASPAGGRSSEAQSRNTFMDRLGLVIQTSLRQGDIFTRFSGMQYLVLLQSITYENGLKVLDRIQRNTNLAYPRSGYLLQCSLLPLLPKDSQQL